jgi:hypothetical protein
MTWYERIEAAEQRGGFTKEDWDLAGGWATCACGEQDEWIPRNAEGKPKDDELRKHGLAFLECVSDNYFVGAREAMARIEQRAAIVLAATLASADPAPPDFVIDQP